MHRAVNDGLLNGLQTLAPADNQLAQGQDEVRFQAEGIVLIGIVEVDVHGVSCWTVVESLSP